MVNEKKRRSIFEYCRKQCDIALLPETHSQETDEERWRMEWGEDILFCHGERNARGVCVLIRNKKIVNIK